MNSDSIQYFHDQLKALPTSCQQDVQLVLDAISEQLPDFDPDHAGTDRDWLGVLPAVLCSSRFIGALLRRDAGYLVELIDNDSLFSALDTGRLGADLAESLADLEDEQEIMRILRRTRNQAMLQIAFRDLAGWASLSEVMQGLSETADALLSTALDRAYQLLVARHGVPLGSDTRQPQQLVALGMGKLGGGELNFSSDVDLIFCFPENGETDSARALANGEFFTRLARLYIKLLTAQTADGFVYRVDTRLRPNGDSGPLTLSFSAMDNYYQLHGRDWERYAFIKARVVAGDQANGKLMLDSLRPFVYRKYLDYAAVESIRDMKEMIERELSRKKEMQRNIKLGPGGIREVEFIAQAHQLIRGGRDRTLQNNGLLITLEQLLASGLIDDNEYQVLSSGYEFLRRCENRLQMYADQQTHNLPESPDQQLILARSMNFADWEDFYQALRQHMDAIHAIFHELFMATARPEDNSQAMRLSHLWQNELADEAACQLLSVNNYQQADELYSRLQTIRNSSLYRNLSTTGRERLDRLLPVLLEEVGQSSNPDETIIRCLGLLSAIARRPVYLSLLLDNAAVRQSLVRITGASPYVSILLNRYPILLDDLLNGYSLEDFQPEVLSESLQNQLASHDREDLEQMMNLLREFQHSKHLGVASLGINHAITASETGRSLTTIADVCINESLQLGIHGITGVYGVPDGCTEEKVPFTVIGYGKLGSRELGFGSDLDMVFLSAALPDSARTSGPRQIYAPQYFARIGQRLVHIITTRTPAGRLYEVDMRLRPSGNAGPLVATMRQMARYQRERAWTWEHQALVRARVVAGDRELAAEFSALRREILTRERDQQQLMQDVVEMRDKMRAAKMPGEKDKFDLKQGYGGIVDIEFMVQYMVLRWAHDYPELTEHTETDVLLDALMKLDLLTADDHCLLTETFSNWLEKSYQLKLNDREAVIAADQDRAMREQVVDTWNAMFARAR